MSVGECIRRARTEKGMSQKELAEAAGVSQQAISYWENDCAGPALDSAILIVRALGMTLDEVFGSEVVIRWTE